MTQVRTSPESAATSNATLGVSTGSGIRIGVQQNTQHHTKFPLLEIRAGLCGGKGVFAIEPIVSGAVVLVFVGELLHEADLVDPDHSIEIGPDLFLGPSGELDDFVNHSCDPNCGLRMIDGELTLFAISEIPIGAELTFDYATCVSPADEWRMDCACGTPRCRGSIGPYAILPDSEKERYTALGVVPDYVHGQK